MRFVAYRTVTIGGFVADANPNITAPSAGNIYNLKERGDQGASFSSGVGLAAVFAKTGTQGTFEDDAVASTITFVLWMRNSTTNGWIRMVSDTATHRLYKTSFDVRGAADVFVQVTAINNTASATTVNLTLREI